MFMTRQMMARIHAQLFGGGGNQLLVTLVSPEGISCLAWPNCVTATLFKPQSMYLTQSRILAKPE